MREGARKRRVVVCVVTYNHARYIDDCLLSVLSQHVDAEVSIIVGDDQSTDGTSERVARIADEWPGRVRHMLHEKRLGPIGNYRAIIAAAEGDFIAHLDGDDLWLPGKLREQLDLLDRDTSCVASCTNAVVFDDLREPVGVFSNAMSRSYAIDQLLRRGNFLNHSSLLYRAAHKDAILAIAPPFIDYRMHLELARNGPISYTSKVFVGYRANATGSMLANANEAVREAYFQAIASALPCVGRGVRRAACVDMARRVFFRALTSRNMALLKAWWPRLHQASGAGRPAFVGQFVLVTLGEGVRQFIQGASRLLLRAPLRVLYFR